METYIFLFWVWLGLGMFMDRGKGYTVAFSLVWNSILSLVTVLLAALITWVIGKLF